MGDRQPPPKTSGSKSFGPACRIYLIASGVLIVLLTIVFVFTWIQIMSAHR